MSDPLPGCRESVIVDRTTMFTIVDMPVSTC